MEAHYPTLDFEMIELDRAEAGSRALFDASKPACLARRYESEARRGFFQALKEFRKVEAEAAEREELAATTPPEVPAYGQFPDPLGSFREGTPPARREPIQAPREAAPMPSPAASTGFGVARGLDGRALTVGRPAPGPA